MRRGPARRWLRYGAVSGGLVALTVAVGWGLLDEAGRHGVVLAGGVALAVQLSAFAMLVMQEKGSPGFLGAWVGSTFLRLVAVVAVALWVAGRDELDTLVTLLTLVGLLFVLLILEPWALREAPTDRSNGTERE